MEKICSKCTGSKPERNFYKDSRAKDGLQSQCRKCQLAQQYDYRKSNHKRTRTANALAVHKYYEAHPEKRIEVYLRRFHLSPAQYDSMLERQGGVCAICRKPESRTRGGKTVRLAVDHNHSCCPGSNSCGKCVRGLLCHACNTAIGSMSDNVGILWSAIEYLNATS